MVLVCCDSCNNIDTTQQQLSYQQQVVTHHPAWSAASVLCDTTHIYAESDDGVVLNMSSYGFALQALTKFIKKNAKIKFELPKKSKKGDDDESDESADKKDDSEETKDEL